MTDESITRRQLARVGVAGGVTVISPAFVTVASGATSSGDVELTTTSTQPTDTSISVTMYEDTSGDGTADNSQQKTISGGTDVVTEFGTLTGTESDTYTYWLDISLDTQDTSSTPQLSEATITLPESGGSTTTSGPTKTPINDGSPQTISEMWDNYLLYVASVIMLFTGIGMGSKALTIGALGGYLAFATIALETGTDLLINILYVTLVLIFIGFAFKFWRLEGMGEG